MFWYAVDVNGDEVPDAVKFAKSTAHGIKWTGGAANDAGKQKYVDETVKVLCTPGNYAEVSDAIMHILIIRYQIGYVKSQTMVEKVLGKSVQWIGRHPNGLYPGYNGFYIRELFGQNHMKIMLGQPYGIQESADIIPDALYAIGQIDSHGSVESKEFRGGLRRGLDNAFGITHQGVFVRQ